MAIKINLLPAEKRVGRDLARILAITRSLGVISVVGFILFGLGLIAFFVISSIQLNNLNSGNDALKTQISGLESSETQIVLLKDKLGKIMTVQKLPSSFNNLATMESILGTLSPATTVTELDVSTTKISTSLNIKSNADLTGLLAQLGAAQGFSAVTLTSFSFNPGSGYLVNLDISGK